MALRSIRGTVGLLSRKYETPHFTEPVNERVLFVP